MKTLVFMLLLAIANAKVYSRCELAKVLKEKRVDGYLGTSLADWVCLAQHESNFNTQATNENSNGSTDYGIFQINNKWWCSDGVFQRNGCGIPCSELLTDDISSAVLCAKKIERVQGLTAWVAWRKYCQGKDLSSYVAGCEV